MNLDYLESLILYVGLLSFSLAFIALVLSQRGRQAARHIVKNVGRLTSRYIRPEPKAYLEIVMGEQHIGRLLEIYGDTPIGRSREVSELLFQTDIETSPISRLHCTILDDETHFLIKDEDSANGTYLNGVRLEPLVEVELHDGDEIELARVERGGVKLRFRLADNFYENENQEQTTFSALSDRPPQGDRF